MGSEKWGQKWGQVKNGVRLDIWVFFAIMKAWQENHESIIQALFIMLFSEGTMDRIFFLTHLIEVDSVCFFRKAWKDTNIAFMLFA